MKTGKHFITESHMHILNQCYLYLSHVACKHCPKNGSLILMKWSKISVAFWKYSCTVFGNNVDSLFKASISF